MVTKIAGSCRCGRPRQSYPSPDNSDKRGETMDGNSGGRSSDRAVIPRRIFRRRPSVF
ncbi:hypothetical protein BRYFOR_06695 [Marvinbryantia formatexigens DSM 14469]|uniref:Uncharacterized protein n=1 Tax=Marvinbryantia formatexigens DSM 14469 TaxID=478749 RepID=C6LD37_9FIRM|nr:hypothetical protein BRYFOR_06695 [Marvinbryantia formatexigens DSM 14469]